MYGWGPLEVQLSYMTSLEGLNLTSVLTPIWAGGLYFVWNVHHKSFLEVAQPNMDVFNRWTNGVWNNTLKGMVPYIDQLKYYLESILNHITI